jgi:hypothetical protein
VGVDLDLAPAYQSLLKFALAQGDLLTISRLRGTGIFLGLTYWAGCAKAVESEFKWQAELIESTSCNLET